jgi:hypothetical protein
MLLVGDQHLVVAFPIQPTSHQVDAVGRIAGQDKLVGPAAQQRRGASAGLLLPAQRLVVHRHAARVESALGVERTRSDRLGHQAKRAGVEIGAFLQRRQRRAHPVEVESRHVMIPP